MLVMLILVIHLKLVKNYGIFLQKTYCYKAVKVENLHVIQNSVNIFLFEFKNSCFWFNLLTTNKIYMVYHAQNMIDYVFFSAFIF